MEEMWNTIEDIKDAEYLWGGADYVLTEDDLKALQEGKIINFSVNMEYGCTLRVEKKEV